jgi:peptide/nickel transport system substrate-binding protein
VCSSDLHTRLVGVDDVAGVQTCALPISSQADNKGSNHISYKNKEVDRILEEYRREFDEQKRIQLYRQFQRILNEDQPYTFLYMPKSAVAYHNRFNGVEVLPIGGLRPRYWWTPIPLQKYK